MILWVGEKSLSNLNFLREINRGSVVGECRIVIAATPILYVNI